MKGSLVQLCGYSSKVGTLIDAVFCFLGVSNENCYTELLDLGHWGANRTKWRATPFALLNSTYLGL